MTAAILLRHCLVTTLLLGPCAVTQAAEITRLDIHFPYFGESFSATSSDGSFLAYLQVSLRSSNAVEVDYYEGQPFAAVEFASFTFDAPNDTLLVPGFVYTGATRYPFEAPGTAGYEVAFNSEGLVAPGSSGSFTIYEVVYGPNDTIEHFGASFLDYNNQGGLGAFGDIYYNFDAPVAPEPASLGLTFAGITTLAYLRRKFRFLSVK